MLGFSSPQGKLFLRSAPFSCIFTQEVYGASWKSNSVEGPAPLSLNVGEVLCQEQPTLPSAKLTCWIALDRMSFILAPMQAHCACHKARSGAVTRLWGMQRQP
jgi:hypothetical protein